MKYKFVQTKNVMMLQAALASLGGRGRGVPGLGLIKGRTGAGKTTALHHEAQQKKAVWVRANASTNLSSLLSSICFELGMGTYIPHRNADRFDAIKRNLVEDPRPIFIDEADYLTRDARSLEILRDIHDETHVPVVLIGMERIERKLKNYPQFLRRISQTIEFEPCDIEDATLLAKELCEVKVSPCLIDRMHTITKGSVGKIIVALSHFEAFAKGHGWTSITAEQWGERPISLGADKVA